MWGYTSIWSSCHSANPVALARNLDEESPVTSPCLDDEPATAAKKETVDDGDGTEAEGRTGQRKSPSPPTSPFIPPFHNLL